MALSSGIVWVPQDRHVIGSGIALPAAQTGRLRALHVSKPRQSGTKTAHRRTAAVSLGVVASFVGPTFCRRDVVSRRMRCRRLSRRAVASATSTAPPRNVASYSDDVVLVYDPTCSRSMEIVTVVDRDCAQAPKRVAYRKVPSNDAHELASLVVRHGLDEMQRDRLQSASAVTAILPSGALLIGLEQDPGPLLRELRYRTCLEYPSAREQEKIDTYFNRLEELREGLRWWHQPEVLSALRKQLNDEGFAVIDEFLLPDQAKFIRRSTENLHREKAMQSGLTTGGSMRVGLPHRGDFLKWVAYGGADDGETGANLLAMNIEAVLGSLRGSSPSPREPVEQQLASIKWRSEMMLTCYPRSSRARYFRHADNTSGNGRLLTAILYLNEGWQEGDGGELRLFHEGQQNLKVKYEVKPLFNRLLLFWADGWRCPHEVLSACQDRYAATVWYYNEPNPQYSLYEVSEAFNIGSIKKEFANIVPPPAGQKATASAPAPAAADDDEEEPQ